MTQNYEYAVQYTYDNGLAEAFDSILVADSEVHAYKNAEWISTQNNVKDVKVIMRPVGEWEDA